MLLLKSPVEIVPCSALCQLRVRGNKTFDDRSVAGYADPHAIQGSDWSNLRGNGVRMSTIKRTSVQSFATLHEVSHVDENQHASAHPNHVHGNQSFFLNLLFNKLIN